MIISWNFLRPDRAGLLGWGYVPLKSLNDESSQDTVSSWDSLGMVALITELERRFKVEFDVLEIVDFNSLSVKRNVLKEKGVEL